MLIEKVGSRVPARSLMRSYGEGHVHMHVRPEHIILYPSTNSSILGSIHKYIVFHKSFTTDLDSGKATYNIDKI